MNSVAISVPPINSLWRGNHT